MAQFNGAYLKGAYFERAELGGAYFDEADFKEAKCAIIKLGGVKFMRFELIEVDCNNKDVECFPDFFDDCNPTAEDCMPQDYPSINE